MEPDGGEKSGGKPFSFQSLKSFQAKKPSALEAMESDSDVSLWHAAHHQTRREDAERREREQICVSES